MIHSQRRIGFLDALFVFASVWVLVVCVQRDWTPSRILEVHQGESVGHYVLPQESARMQRIERRLIGFGDARHPARLGAHQFVIQTAAFYEETTPPTSNRAVNAPDANLEGSELGDANIWATVGHQASLQLQSYQAHTNLSGAIPIEPPISLGASVVPQISKATLTSATVWAMLAMVIAAGWKVAFPQRSLDQPLILRIELSEQYFQAKQSLGWQLGSVAETALPIAAVFAAVLAIL